MISFYPLEISRISKNRARFMFLVQKILEMCSKYMQKAIFSCICIQEYA